MAQKVSMQFMYWPPGGALTPEITGGVCRYRTDSLLCIITPINNKISIINMIHDDDL